MLECPARSRVRGGGAHQLSFATQFCNPINLTTSQRYDEMQLEDSTMDLLLHYSVGTAAGEGSPRHPTRRLAKRLGRCSHAQISVSEFIKPNTISCECNVTAVRTMNYCLCTVCDRQTQHAIL